MRWLRHPGRALDAYLDGEVGRVDTERVADHLAHCELCRQQESLTHSLRAALRAIFGMSGT